MKVDQKRLATVPGAGSAGSGPGPADGAEAAAGTAPAAAVPAAAASAAARTDRREADRDMAVTPRRGRRYGPGCAAPLSRLAGASASTSARVAATVMGRDH
ncbi:hypothetical protein GCM10010305_25560 [Streptomyces termitum]|uniref:Uncharacterized protein n=1 Tax=Streptomyces termitum TaxID=67368 RepID=A0A918T049_9ACTN|nr:hypothetical protein GCM10010305_25560 [Streptomyces termitum]